MFGEFTIGSTSATWRELAGVDAAAVDSNVESSVVAGGSKLKPGLNAKTALTVGSALLTLLQNEDVRKSLSGASAGLRTWAKRTRARFDRTEGHGARGPLRDRYGQGALLHRIDALAVVIPEFATLNPEFAAELRTAEVELRRAAFVAGQMPVTKRLPAQRSIAKRLDKLERALIGAVL